MLKCIIEIVFKFQISLKVSVFQNNMILYNGVSYNNEFLLIWLISNIHGGDKLVIIIRQY